MKLVFAEIGTAIGMNISRVFSEEPPLLFGKAPKAS